MDNQPILPTDLIESLKSKKEENENSERLIKINSAIANKQRDLTEIQITQLVALRDTLSSDALTTLEEKREAGAVAEETLGLLKDIASNTEEDKFDVKLKGGIVSKILSLTSGLLIGFTAGLFQGIIESVKSFKFPTFKKISAKLFSPIIRVFKALADIKKKLGTGQFLKGDTKKIFGAKTIKGLQRIFKFISSVGKWVRSAVKSIKTFGSIIKGGLAKLFSPIITWFKSLKGVLLEFKAFFSSANAKPSLLSRILTPIKNVLGMAKKFKEIFMKLGRLFGKLFLPFTIVLSVFDGIMAGLKEFKTSEYDNIFMKLLDTAFAFLGGVAGSFIGGMVDLVKMGLSWVASKLGFDGLSEWLDSFSIEDMIKEGMSNLLDMLDMLFTDLVPALIAGVAAAVTPGGKSFSEAFSDRMTGGDSSEKTSYGPLSEDEQETFKELNSQIQTLRVDRFDNNKALQEGDTKGGLLGFQYDRADKLQEQDLIMKSLQKERNKLAMKMQTVNKPAVTTGAQMEAMQDDTLGAKAQSAAAKITSVVTDSSSKVNNSITKVSNIGQHFDRTNSLAIAQ